VKLSDSVAWLGNAGILAGAILLPDPRVAAAAFLFGTTCYAAWAHMEKLVPLLCLNLVLIVIYAWRTL
jgi:hypothetical protein